MTETDPQTRRLGYARVSTYGQTLDAQLDQLRAAGCAKLFRHTWHFIDKFSPKLPLRQ
jgi:DNA invertase Pin-like site-specific DNA recombinase